MTEALDYYPEIREPLHTELFGTVPTIGRRIFQWAPFKPPHSSEFRPLEYFTGEVIFYAITWEDSTVQWIRLQDVMQEDGMGVFLKLHCSDRLLVYRLNEYDFRHHVYRGCRPD